MNKGYAFGFLLVLLVFSLGMYVAYTGFTSGRAAVRAQPTLPPQTVAARVAPASASPAPTATATTASLPVPIPGITATLTAAALPGDGGPEQPPQPEEPAPSTPAPAASLSPPALPGEATGSPEPVTPPPTPVPVAAYPFRLGGPPVADPSYPTCCYIYGTVRDAGGVPLEGVLVRVFNEWDTKSPAATKEGGEAGQYNVPLGHDVVTWYIIVVDQEGNQISTQASILFDPGAGGGYRVDWQRSY
jgi:hypothetical protein